MKKRRVYLPGFLLVLSLIGSSCGVFGSGGGEIIPGVERTYAGIYTQGIEDSNFNPCIDQGESWQLNVSDTTFGTKLRKVSGNPVYMKLRGVVSTKGEYRGFFAVYDRRFEVEEVVEVTSTKRKHCF